MPKCPFAQWLPITGPVGPYTSGPFKIVHHTTEGSTARGAFDTFKKNRSDPHFTVDNSQIYQHIDTALAARSLQNLSGGVQTNKDSAVQIEVVGFAHRPKDARTLTNVARLCRWLEATHQIPIRWPNGLPKTAAPDGGNPGGHNRDAATWNTYGGHYGHSQVPENIHWDPAYTKAEVNFLMEAEFDLNGKVLYPKYIESFYKDVLAQANTKGFANEISTMPDHNHEDEYDRY